MKNAVQSLRFMIVAVVLGILSECACLAASEPLQVYILAGQSNMQGHVNISTFDSMANDPKTAPILKEMRGADGKPYVCQKVWISSIGCADDDTTEQKGKLTAGFGASTEDIGPEFTFGIYMEKLTGKPILLIKTSWGGKNLLGDFRPPSAGKRVFNDSFVQGWKGMNVDPVKEAERHNSQLIGVYYRHTIEHVRKVLADIKRVVPEYDEKQGYELAGFVWFQGFNDLVDDWSYPNNDKPGGYDEYGQTLAMFIRDVRKDLSTPKLPFVIGVMGLNGAKLPPNEIIFHQAQAAPASLPEFQGNVVAVQTAPYWDNDLAALQERMGQLEEKMEEEANKNPKLTQEAKDAALQKAIATKFTPEELKRLKAGTSDLGYHYMGAAKIMAPIGKAFAEAMAKLQTAKGAK